MNRRRFVASAAAATASFTPLPTLAQAQTTPTIGILSVSPPDAFRAGLSAFAKGLQSEGFIIGQNVRINHRWVDGHYERFSEIGDQLVKDKVAVILATSAAAARAAKSATSTVPIVFVFTADPVAQGIVTSLASPGANVTGITYLNSELGSKQLQILLEVIPNATVVGFLSHPEGVVSEGETSRLQEAAQVRGLRLLIEHPGSDIDLEKALANMASMKVDGLIVSAYAFYSARRDRIIALAAQYRLPAIYDREEYVTSGGLMSYGGNRQDAYYQAGLYVGKALKGVPVASLPAQQSSKITFALNLKAAKELGIKIPSSVLISANEVIDE